MSFSVTTYPGLKALADRDFEGFKRALYDARPDLAKAGVLDGGIGSLSGELTEIFLGSDRSSCPGQVREPRSCRSGST